METAKSQLVGVSDILQGRIIPLEQPEQTSSQEAKTGDNKEVINSEENPIAQEKTIIEATKTPINEEEIVLKYFKDKGKQINSIDELFTEPQTKEVNPYQEILDDQDKAYLEFKRENPKKTMRDFEAIYSEVNDISPLEFARERVLQEAGVRLTNQQIDQYLEEELGVSLDDEELSATDLVKLSKYGKQIKDQRIAEQKRYREIVNQKANSDTSEPQEEVQDIESQYIKLDNNTIMLRSDYDKLAKERQQYLKDNKEAGDSVAVSVFSVNIDDNGEKQERTYSYEYDDKDRHSMVSLSTDVSQTVRERYHSYKGFNHKQFNEDLFWIKPENRNKAISFIVQKVRAEAIEEVLKNRGNFNFTPTRSMGEPKKDGVKNISVKDIFN